MLEDRLKTWEQNHSIADAFLFLEKHLDEYSEYCANYSSALICLNKKTKREKFAQFVQEQGKLGHYTQLPDYLILPVQRVPVCALPHHTSTSLAWSPHIRTC